MDRRVDLAIAFIVVAVGVFVLVEAQSIRPFGPVVDPLGPASFPRILGSALIIGGGIVAATRLRRWGATDAGNLVTSDGEPDEAGVPASAQRAFVVMALTFAYALTLPLVGYVIGTPVFVAAGLWVMKFRTWYWVALIAIVYTVVTYLVFSQIANARLPVGPLLELFRSWGLTR